MGCFCTEVLHGTKVTPGWLIWVQLLHAQLLSCAWLSATPRTVAHQALLSMGFSTQEYWSRLPLPSPGIFLTQGSNPRLMHLLNWQADALALCHLGSPAAARGGFGRWTAAEKGSLLSLDPSWLGVRGQHSLCPAESWPGPWDHSLHSWWMGGHEGKHQSLSLSLFFLFKELINWFFALLGPSLVVVIGDYS